MFDQFAAADAYLFAVPMWNSGIPYVLKQWIDVITQPGWVFGFTPTEGYTGLIHGKKSAVIYTSGVYSPGVPLAFGADFHASYFSDWHRFAGITDVTEIRWQPTVLTATPDADRGAAIQRAAEAGSKFWTRSAATARDRRRRPGCRWLAGPAHTQVVSGRGR